MTVIKFKRGERKSMTSYPNRTSAKMCCGTFPVSVKVNGTYEFKCYRCGKTSGAKETKAEAIEIWNTKE